MQRRCIFSEVKLIFFKSFLSMDNIALKIGEMGLDALNVYIRIVNKML